MPKTVYAARVEEFRRLILQQPQQHKRIALLHRFLGLGRLSRVQIQFCIARIDELRAELPPSSADMMLLDSLSERVDAAWKRHDRRLAKKHEEDLAKEKEKPKEPTITEPITTLDGESRRDLFKGSLKEIFVPKSIAPVEPIAPEGSL